MCVFQCTECTRVSSIWSFHCIDCVFSSSIFRPTEQRPVHSKQKDSRALNNYMYLFKLFFWDISGSTQILHSKYRELTLTFLVLEPMWDVIMFGTVGTFIYKYEILSTLLSAWIVYKSYYRVKWLLVHHDK